jgi:hypothetical protein
VRRRYRSQAFEAAGGTKALMLQLESLLDLTAMNGTAVTTVEDA